MGSQFDPYLEWLGIPPEDQPPDHYRLLGLELFESDVPVIESAAEKCAEKLHQVTFGFNRDAARKLMSEVLAARRCLLDPKVKATYDAEVAADKSELVTSDESFIAESVSYIEKTPEDVERFADEETEDAAETTPRATLSAAPSVLPPRPAQQEYEANDEVGEPESPGEPQGAFAFSAAAKRSTTSHYASRTQPRKSSPFAPLFVIVVALAAVGAGGAAVFIAVGAKTNPEVANSNRSRQSNRSRSSARRNLAPRRAIVSNEKDRNCRPQVEPDGRQQIAGFSRAR